MASAARPAVLAAIAIIVIAGTAAVETTKSDAAAAPTCRTGADDFDGNGSTDLAIGAYGPTGDDDRDFLAPGLVAVKMRTTDGTRTAMIIPPSTVEGHGVYRFGLGVGEIDLSDHTSPTTPCADLVVSALLADSPNIDEGGENDIVGGVVFLYRWDADSNAFVLLNSIAGTDVDANFTSFGYSLAAQTMQTDHPAPRSPVLYVGASGGSYSHGAVARLVLTPQGDVVSKQIIAPQAMATDQEPLSYQHAKTFGSTLIGTPYANQVIIGDEWAALRDGGGAVVVWNRHAPSQLLTAHVAGVAGLDSDDLFGRALWLNTEVHNATNLRSYLFVGMPGYRVGDEPAAGAALQIRYDRSVHPARVVVSKHKLWTQNSKGVAGVPETNDSFGSSFQALTARPGGSNYLVGVPGENYGRISGVIDVLGNGRSFSPKSLGLQPTSDAYSQIGYDLASWRDITDNMSHDPFPAPVAGTWSRRVTVGDPRVDIVLSGLPAGSVHKSTRYETMRCDNYYPCEFGAAMTASGGG